MKCKTIHQGELSNDECLAVQFCGFDMCIDCEWLNTERCTGKEIRRTGLNKKGFKILLMGL